MKTDSMMSLQELAKVVSGKVVGNEKADFKSVSTDSRTIKAGDLFVALRGERFDGHDFLHDVASRKVTTVLVRADVPDIETRIRNNGLSAVLVSDTRLALGQLARNWRRRFAPILIVVTGSNGKTTTKEMLAAIFTQALGNEHVLATRGNLNNDIGLPLTLLQMRAQHRAVITEIGMNHSGEIASLAAIARPTIAIVTNAQRAHLAGMGEIEAVALEKGSLYAALEAEGIAVINENDRFAALWRQLAGEHRVFTYAVQEGDFVSHADLKGRISGHGLTTRLHLSVAGKQIEVMLDLAGSHNARNAAAAAAVAYAADLDLERIAQGLCGFAGVPGRLQQKKGHNGALILDDTYNANPDSVRAAIDVLASMIGRKLLVLGDMGEIGTMSGQCHDEIGGYAKSQGIDRLLTLGEQSAIAARNFGQGAKHFRNRNELIAFARKILDPDTAILVKGSRFMKMEQIVEALLSETLIH